MFTPHSAQIVSKLGRCEVCTPSPLCDRRTWRHSRQRWGSFWKPFSAKNCCSRAVKVNGAPQSLQVMVLSSKVSLHAFLGRLKCYLGRRTPPRLTKQPTRLEIRSENRPAASPWGYPKATPRRSRPRSPCPSASGRRALRLGPYFRWSARRSRLEFRLQAARS